MDLDPGWKKRVEEKLLQEEGQKEEKEYLTKLSFKMIKFKSLNQSKDFVKILKKKRINTKYFTVYFDKNLKNFDSELNKCLNISFVMKKKIGNAVKRNRAKRIMRELARKIIINGKINSYYVLIAKTSLLEEKFDKLLLELKGKING